jgi:integrase
MRLNELSALPLSNIKPIDGIWCFDLRGLNLKNEASERVIPIAQYLLDEGILDYIKILKKQKEKYFSPQIRRGKEKPSSAGWGDPISRWFNRSVLKNIGINKSEELEKGLLICFHCTRRTFISTCVNNGEEKYLIKRLAGHSTDDDITLGVYSDVDQIDLKLLKNVIDRNLKWHLHDVH